MIKISDWCFSTNARFVFRMNIHVHAHTQTNTDTHNKIRSIVNVLRYDIDDVYQFKQSLRVSRGTILCSRIVLSILTPIGAVIVERV